MYKILKNIIEMDDYSVQKLSKSQSEPFQWNTVEGTEINVNDCIGGKGKIEVKGNTYQENRILPEGYTQVDYIESHGKEYIDTGVNADSNLRTVLDMAYTEPKAKNQNVGAINMGKGPVRYHILPQNELFRIYIQNYNFIDTISLDTNRHLYDIDVPNQIIKVDKNNYSLNTTSFNVELNFWLFGRNSDSTQYKYKSKNKLYKCRMYVSGVLVRDFIPCYRNSDNEVGLYDLVNGVFYTNQGTGAFTYGSVVTVSNTDFEIPIKVVTGNNLIKHVGKNLFDKDSQNFKQKYILNDNGEEISSNISQYSQGYTEVKPNTTYTLQGSLTHKNNNMRIYFYDENKNWISRSFPIGLTHIPYMFTTDSNIHFIRFQTVIDAYDSDTIQLEQGSTATQYEPYKEKDYKLNLGTIELCKIGDYEDILFKNVVGDENYNAELEEGAWYKRKVINNKIFNKSIYFTEAGVQNVYYHAGISDYARNNNIPYCTHLKGFNNVNRAGEITGLNKIGFNNTYDYNRCYIAFDGTLTELRAFLSEKQPSLYYANDNPTYEKITDPTLISQLEALRKAKWFKGVNHIWTETDNLEPVLEGTYKQSIQSETQNSIANLQVQANEQNISNTPESEV